MPANPLLRVCSLLNEAGAHYIVCGGHAVILHGFVRATEDVDILIASKETYREKDAIDLLYLRSQQGR